MTGKQMGTLLGAALAIGVVVLIGAIVYALSETDPENKDTKDTKPKPVPTVPASPH